MNLNVHICKLYRRDVRLETANSWRRRQTQAVTKEIEVSSLARSDIKEIVDRYMCERESTHRYASFDYCYSYFRCSSSEQIVSDIERSCLVLGFYLASWGMFRGKSSLLKRSAKHYEPLVEYIASQSEELWRQDICTCGPQDMDKLITVYNDVRRRIVIPGVAHLTLVTKVMLGVFGVVPAFDTYFGNAFRSIIPDAGFRTFGRKSLLQIQRFYEANKAAIDDLSEKLHVLDFESGQATSLRYPKAKVVDMYGFILGGGSEAT